MATAVLVIAPILGVERSLALLRDKSQSAVEASKYLRSIAPQRVALEQSWAYGERLYLGNQTAIENIDPARPLSVEALRRVARNADAIAVYTRDLTPETRNALRGLGFYEARAFKRDTSKRVSVFLKSSRTAVGNIEAKGPVGPEALRGSPPVG